MGEFLSLVSRLKRCFSRWPLVLALDLHSSWIFVTILLTPSNFEWMNCDGGQHIVAMFWWWMIIPIIAWRASTTRSKNDLKRKRCIFNTWLSKAINTLWLSFHISRIYQARINRSNQESVSYKNLTGSLMRNSKILNLSFSAWIEIHSGVKNLRHIIKKLYRVFF